MIEDKHNSGYKAEMKVRENMITKTSIKGDKIKGDKGGNKE